METSIGHKPTRISDSFDMICAKCKKVAYSEQIIGELQFSDSSYKYKKITTGSFIEECDSEGNITGSRTPVCPCGE